MTNEMKELADRIDAERVGWRDDGGRLGVFFNGTDMDRITAALRSTAAQADMIDKASAWDAVIAAQADVRAQTIEECELAARGPLYKEIYNGSEKGNWSRDSAYGRGRHDAADAISAMKVVTL